MPEGLSLKDVEENALQYMKEKDYESALKNWNYIF